MALNIKDPKTDQLARELAAATGETLTTAISTALRERLERLRPIPPTARLADQLDEIGLRCARLPVIDDRSADEILGYDEHGLPA